MKKLIVCVAVAVSAIAAPALSFAQSNVGLTRAAVQTQLAQLEKAGYNPAGSNNNYPADFEAAQQKVAMNTAQMAQAPVTQSAGGMSEKGRSASGKPMHMGCVGPVSFCNVYFGS